MKTSLGIVPLILTLTVLTTMPGVSPAASKNDGRPDGGSLAYGEYGRPATLDPITSNEMISLRITELVFNGLVGIDEKQAIVSELAERWEASKDGRTYTFFLRHDVRWHPREGEPPKPFTADDVLFTHNIMMHPKTITPLKVRYEFIEKVEKLDDYTVRFTLKRPILNALAKFSFKVIPAHGPANSQYLTREDPFVRTPIGTGPYVVKSITGDSEIVLVANEDYFKGRPHINKFLSKPFADQNIMTQAMMFNAIDMLMLVNPRDLPELQGDKRFVLQPYNALSYAFFGYNLRSTHLADKRVRRARLRRHPGLVGLRRLRGHLLAVPFRRDRSVEEQLRRVLESRGRRPHRGKQADARPREAAHHQPEAARAPRRGGAVHLPLDADELQRLSQEAAPGRHSSLQVLLVRGRMVHPGRGAKVTTKLAAFRRVGVMVVREVSLTALLLLGGGLVVFEILHLSPGDPFSVLLEGQAPGQAARVSVREALGVPTTWYGRYLAWLGHMAHGNLGTSIRTGVPVAGEIVRAGPNTLFLTLGSLLVTLLLAVPIALYSASRRTGALARALTLAVYLISAVPVFWLGYVVIYLFIHRLGLFPLLAATAEPQRHGWLYILLPIIVL